MWKGMECCARKWCHFMCTILFEVIWAFCKMWLCLFLSMTEIIYEPFFRRMATRLPVSTWNVAWSLPCRTRMFSSLPWWPQTSSNWLRRRSALSLRSMTSSTPYVNKAAFHKPSHPIYLMLCFERPAGDFCFYILWYWISFTPKPASHKSIRVSPFFW